MCIYQDYIYWWTYTYLSGLCIFVRLSLSWSYIDYTYFPDYTSRVYILSDYTYFPRLYTFFRLHLCIWIYYIRICLDYIHICLDYIRICLDYTYLKGYTSTYLSKLYIFVSIIHIWQVTCICLNYTYLSDYTYLSWLFILGRLYAYNLTNI